MTHLRISTPQIEGVLQVSKQLKFQVLLDVEEMRALISHLSPLFICCVFEPVTLKMATISTEEFLDVYQKYIHGIKNGLIIDEKTLRRYFSCIWTSDLDCVYAMAVSEEKYLIKPIKPVIQLQGHHFFYSNLDQQFHPMVLSKESITWGIQFSYPQLCQDPQTKEILKIDKTDAFPNSILFSRMTKWLRDHTMPTPFVVAGKRTNASIRIGKQAVAWIAKHPQLKEKGIEVFSLTSSNDNQKI